MEVILNGRGNFEFWLRSVSICVALNDTKTFFYLLKDLEQQKYEISCQKFLPMIRNKKLKKRPHLSEVTPSVRSYPICPKLPHLSEVTPSVRSYPICPTLPHLSEVTPSVRSYAICLKLPYLSEVTPSV